MSIVAALTRIYRSAGYEPLTGYNPYHFNGYMDAPFTRFLKDDRLFGMAGLALQEVMFLEHFNGLLSPRNILIIGNAYGWSTLALALIFPSAKVVAIDPGEEGNQLTRDLAQAHRLNVSVVTGRSPEDVGRACADHFSSPVDLVLIDAVHTNQAVLTDFAACRPEGHDGTVYVFHDVINWKLGEAFQQIKRENRLEGHILTRTPSGMAVLWQTAPDAFKEYVAVFTEDPNVFRVIRQFVVVTQDPMSAVLEHL